MRHVRATGTSPSGGVLVAFLIAAIWVATIFLLLTLLIGLLLGNQ